MTNELPDGWVKASMGDLADNLDGRRIPIKASERATRRGEYPYYGASGPIDTIDDFIFDGTYLLIGEDGANLLSRSTPLAFEVSGKFWVNNHAHVLETRSGVVLGYLKHFINSFDLQHVVTGTAQPKLTQGALNSIEVPLPPSNEQRRIVAMIDAVFEQTRAARARLEQLPASIDALERSILTSAFRGDLTADWRRDGQSDEESASGFLDHIGIERRARWEVTLRTKGKDPTKVRYSPPVEFDNNGIPELPPSWAWTSLSSLSFDSGYGTSEKCSYDGTGEAVLRIPNVASGDIDVTDLKRSINVLDLAPEELIATGDFLIVRTNGSRDLIGRAACVLDRDDAIGHYFASYLIRFRLVSPVVGRWLSLWWRSPFMRRWLESHAASSAGQYNVSLSSLATAPVPIASPTELVRVVELVERGFGVSRLLSERFPRSAAAFTQIEQSTLAKAFRGELVPQDPADEPASELLARLKAQQASAEEKPSRRAPNTRVRRSIMSTSHKDAIREVILKQRTKRFSFEDVRAQVPGDYETLKAALFELLAERSPVVRQVFDKKAKAMQLERVSQ